jgi:hypothetical protein
MSTLSRFRSLAAALALLLFLSANATAWSDRPMDRPEGPPEPNPQEVGDPDQPPNLVLPVVLWKRVFLIRLPGAFARFGLRVSAPSSTGHGLSRRLQRGGHAR